MDLTKCSELGNGAMDHIALFGVTKPLLKSLASLGLDRLSQLKCPFT